MAWCTATRVSAVSNNQASVGRAVSHPYPSQLSSEADRVLSRQQCASAIRGYAPASFAGLMIPQPYRSNPASNRSNLWIESVDHREVQSECCKLATGLVKEVYEQEAAPLKRCGPVLRSLLARVSECLDTNARLEQPQPQPSCAPSQVTGCVRGGSKAVSATATTATTDIVALLRLLTVSAPPALHIVLATTDPLPSGLRLNSIQPQSIGCLIC